MSAAPDRCSSCNAPARLTHHEHALASPAFGSWLCSRCLQRRLEALQEHAEVLEHRLDELRRVIESTTSRAEDLIEAGDLERSIPFALRLRADRRKVKRLEREIAEARS